MMSNPLFNALNNNNNSNNMMEQFRKFRQDMQGKNPNEEINKMLQSGKITQQQLNQAQQMAYQMQNMFRSFK